MKATMRFLLSAAIAMPLFALAAPGDMPSIFWAALVNDVDVAEYYVSRGAPVDVVDEAGMTPLMHAAGKGNVEMVHYLLRAGADPRLKSKYGVTAIQLSKTEAVRDALRDGMQKRSNQ